MWMKELFTRFSRISLRNRIIIAAILCIFIPWISTYFVSDYATKDLLEERAVKQATDELRMIEINIKNVLDDVMYVSNYIQFNDNFNNILKTYQLIDETSPNSRQKQALNHIEISDNVVSITDLLDTTYITILFQNDLYYTNYSIAEYDPRNFYQEEWLNEINQANVYQTVWIGTHPTYIKSEKDEDAYLISVGRRLKQSNHLDAYIIISIKEEQVRSFLENFHQNNNHRYYLTSKEGTIFSSLNENEIGTKLHYDINHNEHQIVELDSEQYFLVSYPVSYSDWRLVKLVPYQETIGDINEMTTTTIFIQGIFLLIFLIVLIVLVSGMTRPMVELNNVTRAVESGDLSRRTNVSGNNDIAKLGQSFNQMLDTIEEMIEQIFIREEEKRAAELEMLQAQIKPHFLFNILNAIRLQIKLNGDKDSAELIRALSSLLRMTINRNNPFITLKEEVNIIEHYTRLINFRHQHEVELDILLDGDTKEIEVPRLFLQPIIENAIIHGYNDRNGSIVISASVSEEQYLELRVTDDGSGMTKDKLNELKSTIFKIEKPVKEAGSQSFNGIGIQNVYQRLKIIYGDHFSMMLESEEGIGTSYFFYIPIQKG